LEKERPASCRRDRKAGLVTDRIANPWGGRTPFGQHEEWPVRVDQFLEDGVSEDEVDRWVQTASILHSNGDALDIAVKDGRMVGVRGRAVDRVNKGRLGPKDLFGWQANNSPDRLKKPLVRKDGELVEASWDEAFDLMVERSKRLLEEKGPLAFGFYTTGQLFLEEYYTLGVIGKAGLGTPHMDGNTRLCTATAGQALKETFGSDGQPGSYADINHADTILLFGHNMAETQAVTWMRILDRLTGPNPPKLVVVDPRPTPVAKRAAVHLPIMNGTNMALLNAFLHEILENGWYDEEYVSAHTIGFEELKTTVAPCTPEWAAEICGVEAGEIREAARLIGVAEKLLSTALQGVYQSHQATASACQINNIHLVRGMLGRPGCGVLQFNGQPTAQNTRETGANGDLPAFRNWDNVEHVQELADLWNVDRMKIPHWAPPTHAMQIFRYAETGSITFLWISCTNPAVSLPELHRIRNILQQESLFVVVQDIFLSETAQLADVVLPAATWGEKTGTYTNTDRTVHISEAAVEPPSEAKHDLDVFLEYSKRMDFRDKDGAPRGPAHQVGAPRGGLRGVEGMHQGPFLRLHGPHLREAPGRLGDTVAVQRGAPGGHRALLRRLQLQHLHRDVRDLRPRPPHGRGQLGGGPPGDGARGQGLFEGGGIHPAARAAGRGVPLPVHDGAHDLPFPHPHQDRPRPAAQRRRPRRVGRDLPRRRRIFGRRGGRRGARRVAAGPHGGEGAHQRHPEGRRLRAVPLRLLRQGGRGRPGRARQSRERADDHGMGPRLQAAALQDRGRKGDEGRRRERRALARPDDDGLGAGR
jgi:formylmethanofuran dehydrogenase subunit B